MQRVTSCPICENASFSFFLSCEDHTVSHETFNLERCHACGFVLTNPRPDEKDLPHYYKSTAYISHSNKSNTLVDHLYKISRAFTLSWKYNLVQRWSPQKPISILDYGCGTGAFLEHCRKKQMTIAGIEPSDDARAIATTTTKTHLYRDLIETTGTFDVITLWHVLEHVIDLNSTIEELKSRLQQNGTMFIAVPNLLSNDAKKYSHYWAAYDVPRHLWHFSRKTMEMLLKKHRLSLITTIPMRLDAYYVSMLSEKYQNGKNALPSLVKAFLEGWKSNQAARQTQEYSSSIYIVRQ